MTNRASGLMALLALMTCAGCRSFDTAPLPDGQYQLRPPKEGPIFQEWLAADLTTETETRRAFIYIENNAEASRMLVVEADSMLTLLDATQHADHIACTGPLARSLHGWDALPFALLQIGRWPEEAVRQGLPATLTLDRRGDITLVTSDERIVIRITKQDDASVVLEIPAHHIKARMRQEQR